MIEIRLGVDGVGRTRFAYSPLAEVAESLHRLLAGRLHPLHQPWLPCAREALRHADAELLAAVLPGGRVMASFLFVGADSPATTMEEQLETLLALPAEEIRSELARVWAGASPPPAARRVLRAPGPGAREIADSLWTFWERALAPSWPRMRGLLDDDVAHRAARLTSGGYDDLLNGLHPKVTAGSGRLRVEAAIDLVRDASGEGLLLVPSVFTWPELVVSTTAPDQARLVYGARGVGRLWEEAGAPGPGEDPLGALLGRTRAAMLRRLDVPQSTTQLAAALGQSPGTISQHLVVLRDTALVTSWRSGRRVLSRRTPLAASLLRAAETADSADPDGSARESG